jgi:type II secretory pathway pseudopilin PulG
MNRHPVCRRSSFRPGVTLIEATVALVVVVIVVILAMPVLSRFRERGRRIACSANLRQIAQAVQAFRAADPAQSFPRGATYQKNSKSAGTSWWLKIMPYSDMKELGLGWKKGPDNGDFGGPAENPNILEADGFRHTVFFCPSSPLPPMNDPERHLSEANRRALGERRPAGIAVPMYAAVTGGAPDALDVDVVNSLMQSRGRNTRDGKYGILSSSGVMPVNIKVSDAGVRDTKSKTIMIVEQSNYFYDETVDPPDLYDLRSAWPKGAFMGATGDYLDIKPKAEDVNGSGAARVWNATTVRYVINNRKVLDTPGIVHDPAPLRPAKKGDPPPQQPPYPPEGYGPGHNHGIFSAHPGGAHVIMADGSGPFLNDDLDLAILIELSTRDDGRDSGDF